MPNVNLKPGDRLYFVDKKLVLSHEVTAVGRTYAYLGRRKVELNNLILKVGNYQVQYFLTEAAAQVSVSWNQARSRCEEKLRELYSSNKLHALTIQEIQQLDAALSEALGAE